MSIIFANRLISKCKSWDDFTAAVDPLDKKKKGDVFERLTQLYLLTKSEYKTTLKNVWLYSEIPARVRKEIKALPVADEGIDLVAETRDGEFWAIQSKYRTDKDKPLTYKELSTFTNLAFNTCKGSFVQAIVVHTVSKPVKKRKLLGNTVEIGLQRWLEMDADHWTLIRRTIGNKPARPKKRTPRPHQRKAIRAAAKHFVDHKESRGKLIMPCGTGKSLTAFWIASKLEAKTVLLVVPSLALIKQSVEDWTQEMVARGEDNLTEWLCICSDESAGSVNRDDFVSDTYATGLPVTTDAKKIGAFLKKRTKRRKIVFVTYQSSPVFAKAARRAGAKFDLAVLDEAHKTAGEKSKAFATLLFDKNLPIKKRIFMTATERVMRGANDEVVSMDKVDIYGDCFYQLSFKEAIHSDPPIISDYKILTIFVTEDEIRSAIKDRQFVSDRKYKLDAKDSRELASAIALRKAYKKYRIKHAVSFHRSIQGASDFSDLHESLNATASLRPKVECFHISSKKTTGQRTELLKDFAGSKRSLITNARCLTEGVDVPAIDCVLFADPKQSTIDIVQAAGRALRPHADKKFGYIMLPIIVPKGKTIDKFAETTEFKSISRVITALSTNDERIAEEFRVVKRGKRTRGEIVRFDGNVPVGMKIDFEAFADAISAKVWQRAAKVNWRPFEEAREFARSLQFLTRKDWNAYINKKQQPSDIPPYPEYTYRNLGWAGVGDWLGTGNVHGKFRQYRSFKEARKFARNLKLQNTNQWKSFCKAGKLPSDIPANPYQTYLRKGWVSWGDWLGTDYVANQNRQYRSFKDARNYARAQKLNTVAEWKKHFRTNSVPDDIPYSAAKIYQHEGWISWGDWLGTGFVANQNRKHRSFGDARRFVRSLSLKSQKDWRKLIDSGGLPTDIPKGPDNVYRNQGWISWGDWLGTGFVTAKKRKYRAFKDARKYARSLNLKSKTFWEKFKQTEKMPDDIPRSPEAVYRSKGWVSWGDWLGTKNIAPSKHRFKSFLRARKFARNLKLQNTNQWKSFCKAGKLPSDIPANPYQTYLRKGWVSWGDWLGTDYVANQNRQYRSFKDARNYARAQKLNTVAEWKKHATSPEFPIDLPRRPWIVYKHKGWKSIGDWLGTNYVATFRRKYRSFLAARTFAHKQKFTSGAQWFDFSKSGKLPDDIPANPAGVYKNRGWKGMGDWLGTGYIAHSKRKWRPFKQARKFVRGLHLKSQKEWNAFCASGKLPPDIPRYPQRPYKENGWIGMADWLGAGIVHPKFRKHRSFNEARRFSRSLGLKTSNAWRQYAKSGNLPADIPAAPWSYYRDKGWLGMGDWLGTGNVHGKFRQYRSFEKARVYVRLLRLNSGKEWKEFAKSKKRPADIPSNPNQKYSKDGWVDMADWLGTNQPKKKKS